MIFPARRLLWVLVAVAPLGCVDRFQTPSAYSEQRYLCDPALKPYYDKAVENCRTAYEADGSCAGVFSFQGTLDQRPFTVESNLTSSSMGLFPSHGTLSLDEVAMDGTSPYFSYVVKIQSIGGAADLPGGGTRQFALAAAPNTVPDPLEDNLVRVAFRLTGSDTVGFQGNSGTTTITTQLANEVAGSFTGAFGENGETISGCFDVLTHNVQTEDAPQQ